VSRPSFSVSQDCNSFLFNRCTISLHRYYGHQNRSLGFIEIGCFSSSFLFDCIEYWLIVTYFFVDTTFQWSIIINSFQSFLHYYYHIVIQELIIDIIIHSWLIFTPLLILLLHIFDIDVSIFSRTIFNTSFLRSFYCCPHYYLIPLHQARHYSLITELIAINIINIDYANIGHYIYWYTIDYWYCTHWHFQ